MISICRTSYTEQSRQARDEMHEKGFRSYIVNREHPLCGEEVRRHFQHDAEGRELVCCVCDDPSETFWIAASDLEPRPTP